MRLHNNSKSLHVPALPGKPSSLIRPYFSTQIGHSIPPTRKTPTRALQSHSSRFVKLQLIIDKATTRVLQTHSSRLAKTRLMFYPPIPQKTAVSHFTSHAIPNQLFNPKRQQGRRSSALNLSLVPPHTSNQSNFVATHHQTCHGATHLYTCSPTLPNEP